MGLLKSINYVQMLFRRGSDTAVPTLAAGEPFFGSSDARQLLVGDGTNAVNIAQMQGRLSLSVAGNTDVTLTAAQYYNGILEFTGALTGNINVKVGLIDGSQWTVFNNTTGAYSLTIKATSGTGIAITQGKRGIVYCDGTNVVRVSADV